MAVNNLSAGYSIPDTSPTVSSAASAVRSAAVLANTASYALPVCARRVVDQKDLECCVSCALGAGMEIINASWPALSPLFHYYVTRYELSGADQDGFLYLQNALQSLATVGICSNALHNMPFTSPGAQTKPASAAYDDAKGRALARRGVRNRYASCSSTSVVAWARDQLRRNCPVVIGLRLPMGYPSTFLNSRFEWVDPNLQASDSGHCVIVIGFSDVRQALRIQDSRGSKMFDGGQWWMGYQVADSAVVREAYCLLP